MVQGDAMLLISLLLAAVTAFFVPPDAQYLGYYDLKTLACLFSVLAVVAALRDLNIFAALSQRLVRTFGTVRSVAAMLIMITMLGSMLLTNDTALLTFLPLSWFVMHSTGQDKHIPLLFVLQNCAANLCRLAHALRKSAESLSLQLLQYPDERVSVDHAAALCDVNGAYTALLLCVSSHAA